jgi:signal transduction histidine kinase
VIIIGIIWNLILIINIPADIEFTRNNVQSIVASLNDINNTIIRHTVSITASYIPTSIFVVMFSFTIIAERKSRERAEILAKEVESLAATLERTRIARDIHDSLGHTLTTLDVQLELAQRLYIKQSEQASQALDTAKLLSSQCLQDVRRALQTMRSQDFNLNEALQNLVEQVRINQSFSVDVKVNLPPIPLQPSHQIFCIIQEGLTNIQKHAKAEFICLTGNSVVGGVQLELSDDGCGFDINASTSGYGLRGMHERVQMLGGNLTINSSPAIGTKIVVWIPLQ